MTHNTDPRPPRTWWQRLVRGALPWAAIAVLGGVAIGQMGGGGGPDEGERVPTLAVELDDGRHFDLAAQHGHVSVVNFWGTYCPPCRAEAPVLTRAWQRMRGSGDTLIGVAVDRAALTDVTRFARGLGMAYPIAVSPPEIMGSFRVRMVPTTVIVDRHGVVARTLVGEVSDESLWSAIEAARGR